MLGGGVDAATLVSTLGAAFTALYSPISMSMSISISIYKLRAPECGAIACSTSRQKRRKRQLRCYPDRYFSSIVDDVIICRRKGARDGYFEFITLLELVSSSFWGFRRKTSRRKMISKLRAPECGAIACSTSRQPSDANRGLTRD